MSSTFVLRYPPEIHFGDGCAEKLSGILRERKVKRLLVCHSRSAKVPQLDEFSPVFLTDLPHEAPLHTVSAWIAKAREVNADAVIAIGGGAVMDAGKAVAAIAPFDLDLHDVFYGKSKIPAKGLTFIALPTTAGTGSEMTPNAVLFDAEKGVKQSIRGPGMMPDVAMVDPLLTVGCPPEITVNSGLDAFVQAVESFCSNRANCVTHLHALESVALLYHSLWKAFAYPDDPACRHDPALGSMLAGMAFANSGLGAVHGLAHPLGALTGIPHGRLCAILLPAVLELNMIVPETRIRLATLGKYCKIEGGAEEFVTSVAAFIQRFGIDLKLPPMTDAERASVIAGSRSNSMSCNPRQLTDDELDVLLRSLS